MGSWENSRFFQVYEIIEREIMGEINQVVPNLISESISGRKNQDGALRRQIYQPCDVSGA